MEFLVGEDRGLTFREMVFFFWLPHPKNAHVSRNKGTFPKGKKGELVVSRGVLI